MAKRKRWNWKRGVIIGWSNHRFTAVGLPPRCRAYGFTTHIVQGSLKTLVFPFQAAYAMERRRLIAKTYLTVFRLPLYVCWIFNQIFFGGVLKSMLT